MDKNKKKREDLINNIKQKSNNFKDIIPMEELGLSGNGTGNRWCNGIFIYTVIYLNLRNFRTFNNNIDIDIDEDKITEFRENFKEKHKEDIEKHVINKNSIIGIMIHTINDNKETRPISSEIREKFKDKHCVQCGSSCGIVIDHKNDLYNDKKVLNVNTQTVDDFQVLCTHCNLLKRQISIDEKKNKKIYSAKNLDRFKIYDFEFPWEKIYFDITNKDIKNCSFWYDPIEFQRKIRFYELYTLPIVKQIKLMNPVQ